MSGREEKKLPVPKFSSFKPKTAEPAPAQEPAAARGKDDVERPPHRSSGGGGDGRHRHRSRRSHRHGGDKRTRSASRSPSPKRPRTRDRDRSRSPRETGPRPGEARGEKQAAVRATTQADRRRRPRLGPVCDRQKGDPLLPKYGADRYKQVAFYRPRRERVLGTEGYLYIHRDAPLEQFSIRKPGEMYGAPSLRDKNAFRVKLRQVEPRLLRASKKAARDTDGPEEDFISLKPPKKKKNRGLGDSSEDERGPNYRSILGKEKAKGPLDDEGDGETSDDDDMERTTDPLNEKSIELSRRVKEHPDDIPAWLELISHQDVLMKAGANGQEPTANEVRSFSEIKLSMYDKALAQVWDPQAHEKRWAKIEKEVEDSFLLWKTRLDYKLSDIVTFRYDALKQMFIDRLALVARKADGEVVRVRQMALYRELLYVFLRATRFFHDCGYRELAVASWQALLELNFCGPEFPNPAGAVPESFQEFWESEVPRVGEPAALGWRSFLATGDDSSVPEAAPRGTGPGGPQSRDVYKAWALKAELFDAFLAFCQLPPVSPNKQSWGTDPHLAAMDGVFEQLAVAQPKRFTEGDESTRAPPPLVQEAITAAIAPKAICSLLLSLKHASKESLPVELPWVARTLGTLVASSHEDLAQHCLALEYISNPSGVKNAARTLLKQYRQNIGLYNLYALLEWDAGNLKAARSVLSAATQLDDEAGAQGTRVLWLSWAWIEFASKSPAPRVLARLCFVPDAEGEASPALVLKQKQDLRADSESAFRRDDLDAFAVDAKLLALAEYLSSDVGTEPRSAGQGSISAAMDVVWDRSERLAARGHGDSAQHEELLEFAALLLYRHSTLGPYRRVYISDQLKRCIQLFPTNTNFIALFDWAASVLRVGDEFRNLVADLVLVGDRDSVALRACAIAHELGAGGSTYAAGAAFARAGERGCRGKPVAVDVLRAVLPSA
ncbi:unnamed protein product [Parascedosporium putredinis]|uniref:DUF1740-domain-containing protein n=1 Tax=Parascedosporium putredinis TaxID=1442378 RepID=A0A9P1M5Y4_9PEZI|nr:unnamed protein product [Parascedosporium putredinis]CAI7988665.1 unnamed protein product [Parascedosporium putredinis]